MAYQDAFEALINLDDLAAYYHVDTRPERKPLVMVCGFDACSGLKLEKFGEKVTVTAQRPAGDDAPYLEITTLDERDGRLQIGFAYAVEGVQGSVAFSQQNGAWVLTDSDVYET